MRKQIGGTLLAALMLLLAYHEIPLEIIHGIETGGLFMGLIGGYTILRQHLKDRRVELKIDAILEKEGIQWPPSNGQANGLRNTPLHSRKRLFISSPKVSKPQNPRRNNKMKEILLSKKFWLAIIGAIIPVVNKEFNINLDENTIFAVLGVIISAILGIAHVDGKKAANQPQTIQVKSDPNRFIQG
jgi:uncharacterized membrane protein